MPITETQAKLWFDTEEKVREYDDRMVANIELKSLDFDDENFSPVFNRATQEVFLHPSDRFRADFHKLYAPFKSLPFDQAVDKYVNFAPDHTFWRGSTINKFLSGFGISYLLLRELPVRNFYARCFIMYCWFAKLFDHLGTWWPYFGPQGNILGAYDRYVNWDLRCYDNVWRAKTMIYPSTASNNVNEGKVWSGKQPAHILRADFFFPSHYLGRLGQHAENTHWDGTMNMPVHRLADPRHKDSYMICSDGQLMHNKFFI